MRSVRLTGQHTTASGQYRSVLSRRKRDSPPTLLSARTTSIRLNPVTSIRLRSTPGAGRVVLTVYDVLGQEQATLVDGEFSAGTYTVSWDAGRVASGVYFCRMRAGDFVATKRMLLVRK